MADKKKAQASDNMNPESGIQTFKGNPVAYRAAAPLQDGVSTPLKGSQVPPMKQPKDLG